MFVVFATLHGQAALARRGDHLRQRERAGVGRLDAQPREPGRGEHGRVDLPVLELAQARVDVAAEVGDGQPGEGRQQLGAAPHRRGPDHRARRQGRFAGDQHVERVRALGDGTHREAVVVLGGQVLGRVHRQVELAGLEGVEDRVHPETLESLRRILGAHPFVPRGAHGDDLRLRADAREARPDLLGLCEREPRAAGADAERRHSASRSMPNSSASIAACTFSVPGAERSFSSTMGSCSSFATMPRASDSTAARSSASSADRRDA